MSIFILQKENSPKIDLLVCHPTRPDDDDPNEIIKTTDELAEQWSVYAIDKDGTEDWIADFDTLEEAHAFMREEKILPQEPEKARNSFIILAAQDEAGNTFDKRVSFREGRYGAIISLGFPVEFYLSDLMAHPPADDDRLWLDAQGRNHKGSPVFCSFSEVIGLCREHLRKAGPQQPAQEESIFGSIDSNDDDKPGGGIKP